jgi:predicted lipase
MPVSIAERLIAAARQTYRIQGNGEVRPDPGDAMIGWEDMPRGFLSGLDAIDGALIGHTPGEIIVAFRGTFPFDSPDHAQMVLDWLNDCDEGLVVDENLPGKVHKGFRCSLNDLLPLIKAPIGDLVQANPQKPIHVTGHSKGGAVANLAARRLRDFFPKTPIIVTTFAAPKPGDSDFQADYDKAVAHSVRYECSDDIVPHVPPNKFFRTVFSEFSQITKTLADETMGYVAVGDLHFIDWNGKIVPDSPLLQMRRIASLAEQVLTFGFRTVIRDHSIDSGSVYDKGIAQAFAESSSAA